MKGSIALRASFAIAFLASVASTFFVNPDAFATTQEAFDQVPAILATHVTWRRTLAEAIDSILANPRLTPMIQGQEMVLNRIDIKVSQDAIKAVRDARLAYVPGKTPNPYMVAAKSMRGNHHFSGGVDSGARGVTVLLTIPSSFSIDGDLESFKRIDRETFNIFDRVLRWILFEEFFHVFEKESIRETGKSFNADINRWAKDRDIPLTTETFNPAYQSWFQRQTWDPRFDSRRQADNLIWERSSVTFWDTDFPELSIFLEAPKYLPIWFANRQFQDYLIENYPHIRGPDSKFKKEVFRERENQRACEMDLVSPGPAKPTK